jgi:hypothetical protein
MTVPTNLLRNPQTGSGPPAIRSVERRSTFGGANSRRTFLSLAFMGALMPLGVASVASLATSCDRRDRMKRRVVVETRTLKYFEGERSLEFQIDWLDRGRRVVYVPTAERWKAEIPDWARERREEILVAIKTLTKKHNFIWEEY